VFEVHGWASVTSSTYEIDGEADAKLVRLLQERIEGVRVRGLVTVHLDVGLNGDLNALSISGFRNHRYDLVIELFQWLAKNAPGSYGLLYVHDDEDFRRGADYQNVFRVWRLARGTLQEMDDPFLSPRIPVTEDPFDLDAEQSAD
jgi:hypothetical protein